MSEPVGKVVVTHWALLDVTATAPQPLMVEPLTLKATVPVAPVVSAALIVTLVPKELEVGFALRVVLEEAVLTVKVVSTEETEL